MDDIIKGMKYTFLIHFIVGTILGIELFFIPEIYVSTLGWPYLDPAISRITGAAFLALAASSLLCFKEKEWEKVKIVVEVELIWLSLSIVAQIWGLLLGIPVAIFLLNVLISGLLLFAFAYFYFKQRQTL
jgi:hypothetical protein